MNKNIQSLLATVVLACLSQTSIAQTKFVYVSTIPGNRTSANSSSNMNGKITLISTDQRWTADKVYIVDKMVFVEEPAVLTIEPGTLVRFEGNTKTGTPSPINPNDPGAIFICRGAKIVAQGTADAPIIFTNLDDPFVPGGSATIPSIANGGLGKDTSGGYVEIPSRSYTTAAAGAAPRFSVDGEWGGLVILGKARLAFGWADNQPSPSDSLVTPTITPAVNGKGITFIEGTSTIDGTVYGVTPTAGYTFSGGLYGGTDDEDNSGAVRFMSIRYGGFVFAPNNELNGLTTGALGKNTSIEFVEIYNNADDDFEPFGGRNHFRYIAGTCGGDDGFDIDQGYNGNVQFLLQLQGNIVFGNGDQTGRDGRNEGDILGEWDGPEVVGSSASSRSFPYTVPTMFNATHIGMGNDGITRKENSGGKVYNSLYINPTGLTITGGNSADAANDIDGSGSVHRLFVTRTSGGQYNESGVTNPASEPDLFWKYTTFATKSGSLTYAGLATTAAVQTKINSGNSNQVTSYTNRLTTVVKNLPIYSGLTTKQGSPAGAVGQQQNTPLVTPSSPSEYYGSLDPRTGADVDAGICPSQAGPAGYAAKSGWFVETDFRGAFKDGNWLSGWSVLEDIGVAPSGGFATAAFPVPTVKRVVSGNIARVTFNTEANVKYSIQTSEDSGKTFLPVHTAAVGQLTNGLVSGDGSVATVDLAGKGSTKLLVRVMPL